MTMMMMLIITLTRNPLAIEEKTQHYHRQIALKLSTESVEPIMLSNFKPPNVNIPNIIRLSLSRTVKM